MSKRFGIKKMAASVTAVALLLTAALPSSAYAGSGLKAIDVTYNNTRVNLNGQQLSLKDAGGNAVEPINYNGTIYLPVRAVSQALGLTVSYDAEQNAVVITSDSTSTAATSASTPPTGTPPTGTPPTGTPPTGTPPTGTPPTGNPPTGAPATADATTTNNGNDVQKQIEVTYSDIKVILDGGQITLNDSNGNIVEPFNYNGTVYLPVRALAQALGLTVSYDSNTKTVQLGGNNNGQGGQVSQADPGGAGSTN